MIILRIVNSRLKAMNTLQSQFAINISKKLTRDANRHLTIRKLPEVRSGPCYEVSSEEVKMHSVDAKFMLRLMTGDQKANRVRICRELLVHSNEDQNFLSWILEGNHEYEGSIAPRGG